MPVTAKAKWAVDLFYRHLEAIPHPELGVLRLVQFSHDSPGLRRIRQGIAEGLVMLVEENGGHMCNGLSEAVTLLTSAGYTVTPPSADDESEAYTAPEFDVSDLFV